MSQCSVCTTESQRNLREIMKSESEIRAHLQDLLTVAGMPCSCSGTRHADDCQCGGKMMAAVAGMLQWVLGESSQRQAMVDEMARVATEYRRKPFVMHPQRN